MYLCITKHMMILFSFSVKHSQSFAVTQGDGGNMEEMKETARRLTSDSNFRESVYKIITRKDGTNRTDV